jgi:hypothetical protein
MDKINVGLVKMIILEKLNESLLNEKSLNILKEQVSKFCNIVNNSPILQLEYKIFENIENKFIDNDVIATRYIDNNIKLFEKYSIEDINIEHNKLLEFINDTNINTNKKKINESIHDLIIESNIKNTDPNIDLLHESFINVLNYLKTNNKENVIIENNETNFNNSIVEIAISKFNDKFNELGNDDKDLFKILTKSSKEEKKSIFEKYKSDIKVILENANNNEIKERIDESINKIDKMEYNYKTINDDIITLFELNKALKTE